MSFRELWILAFSVNAIGSTVSCHVCIAYHLRAHITGHLFLAILVPLLHIPQFFVVLDLVIVVRPHANMRLEAYRALMVRLATDVEREWARRKRRKDRAP